jgi:hypothetical protein
MGDFEKPRRGDISVAHDVSRGNKSTIFNRAPEGRHNLKYDETTHGHDKYAALFEGSGLLA